MLKMYKKSHLTYNRNHSFQKYQNIKKIHNLSLKSKYSLLKDFFNDVYNTTSELYNTLLRRYFDKYYDLWDAKDVK